MCIIQSRDTKKVHKHKANTKAINDSLRNWPVY